MNSNTVAILANAIKDDPNYNCGTEALLAKDPNCKELPIEYMYIYDKLSSQKISMNTISIILLLLDFNEFTRLGAKANGGLTKLKEHHFFKWEFSTAPTDALNSHNLSQGTNPASAVFQMSSTNSRAQIDALNELDAESGELLSEDAKTSPAIEIKAEYCWDLFEQKQIIPPFIPHETDINDHVAYSTFDEMMNTIDKVSWLKQYPSTYYDEYFQNW